MWQLASKTAENTETQPMLAVQPAGWAHRDTQRNIKSWSPGRLEGSGPVLPVRLFVPESTYLSIHDLAESEGGGGLVC